MADDTKDLVAALAAPVINSKGFHYNCTRYPLNIKLPDKLKYRTKIYVHGAASLFGYRFSINLTDAEVDGNTILHFNPRFEEECVVRNTHLNAWGVEERFGGFPFVAGEPFLICITSNVYGYEVEVNGALFITYKHRMPLRSVTHIRIVGEVTVYGVHITPLSTPKNTDNEDEIDHIDFDIISLNDVSPCPACPATMSENPTGHIDDSENNNIPPAAVGNVSMKPEYSTFKTPKAAFIRNNKRMRSDIPDSIERAVKCMVTDLQRREVADEFSHFGQNIACQLRQLPLADALECQAEILSTVQKKRLGLMHRD